MISITNIQKNIRRAEVWGNIAVLRCGSGSGKPEFFVGGVCDSEISAQIFGVFMVAVVVVVVTDIVLLAVVVVYGFALLLRCFALLLCCFALLHVSRSAFHPICKQTYTNVRFFLCHFFTDYQ